MSHVNIGDNYYNQFSDYLFGGWNGYPSHGYSQGSYNYPYYGYGSYGYPYYNYQQGSYNALNYGYTCPACGTNNSTRALNNRW